MADAKLQNGGLPAVRALTGEERESIRKLNEERDALRLEWRVLDASLRACKNEDVHHHHIEPHDGEQCVYGSPDDPWSALNCPRDVPRTPCPGAESRLWDLTDVVGPFEDLELGLLLDKSGLMIKVDQPKGGFRWSNPSGAPIARLRELAPVVTGFLEMARTKLMERTLEETRTTRSARENLRPISGRS